MKIAFWSMDYEKSCAFHNFVAISIASVMQYPYTITAFENYLGKDNANKAYFSSRENDKLRYGGINLYEGGGIEGLLRRLYHGNNNTDYPNLLRHFSKEVIPKHLFYIPQGGIINSEIFDYELNYNIKELLRVIEENTDICYINVNRQNHLSSKAILQEADLVVINLCQDSDNLNEFFQNYSSLLSKSIFILGNYSPKSFMSCKRISKYYDIPLEEVLPLPYSEDFNLACNQGRAIEFVNSNYMCTRENPNFLFIHCIRKATYMILKKTHIFIKNEDRKHCYI